MPTYVGHWLNVELIIERNVDSLQREMEDRGKYFWPKDRVRQDPNFKTCSRGKGFPVCLGHRVPTGKCRCGRL